MQQLPQEGFDQGVCTRSAVSPRVVSARRLKIPRFESGRAITSRKGVSAGKLSVLWCVETGLQRWRNHLQSGHAPVCNAVFLWVHKRASAVQQLHIETQDYPRDQPDCAEKSRHISTQVQIQELLHQATCFRNLRSLKLMLNSHRSENTASTILASVWDQVMTLSELQSLTLIDHDKSDQLAKGLVCLSSLTTLTSLRLQKACECPPGCSLSQFWISLPVDLDDLCNMVLDLQLQDLTLASMCFNSDIDTLWNVIAQLNLKHLKLEYISFHDFNYFCRRDDSAEMPAAASQLLSLR